MVIKMIPAKEYMVVSKNNIAELVNDVNRYIAVGWQPQGGISVALVPTWDREERSDGYESEYCQAMVR